MRRHVKDTDGMGITNHTAFMQCNIPEGEDIKLNSTLKLLAKDHTVSARIIDRLKPETNN